MTSPNRATAFLLNIAHAIDHMFLLIFATAVAAIAQNFGYSRWEDLMPFGAGAFVMFGFASLPAGRLGDLWGRRAMMIIFFVGMGVSCILAGVTQGAWQLAMVLTVLGVFSSIYHPVGIPMLVQGSKTPGFTIGVNGLVGNLGIAVAALATGLIVKYLGWRLAFVIPGVVSLVCGVAFALLAPRETEPPAKRVARSLPIPPAIMLRIATIVTLSSSSASLLFNFTTNGNAELLRERLVGAVQDPAMIGMLLAAAYTLASFAQLVVGKMIDRFPLKRVYLSMVVLQAPLFALAAWSDGWLFYLIMILFMTFLFGAIPFTDAITVRYVEDRMRSRFSGIRIALSFGLSSIAVWLLGPIVKAAGFSVLLVGMAVIAIITLILVLLLPADSEVEGMRTAT